VAEEVGYMESPPELGLMVGVGIVVAMILAFVVVLLMVRR